MPIWLISSVFFFSFLNYFTIFAWRGGQEELGDHRELVLVHHLPVVKGRKLWAGFVSYHSPEIKETVVPCHVGLMS